MFSARGCARIDRFAEHGRRDQEILTGREVRVSS